MTANSRLVSTIQGRITDIPDILSAPHARTSPPPPALSCSDRPDILRPAGGRPEAGPSSDRPDILPPRSASGLGEVGMRPYRWTGHTSLPCPLPIDRTYFLSSVRQFIPIDRTWFPETDSLSIPINWTY